MHPIILKLGPLTLSSYGLMLAIAFFVGIYVAKYIAKHEGLDARHVESISFWMVISGILGARLLYTFVEYPEYYWRHPLEFFAFRKGGLSFTGGFVLSIMVAIFYCRKYKISFWMVADALTPSIALGLTIAKIGCFLAGCCHGKICDQPWGVVFQNPETLASPRGVPLHPSQLYEATATLLLFIGLLLFRKHKKFHGQIFLCFVILYGIIRSFLEIFRGHPGHIGHLTTAQFLNIPIILAAVVLWTILLRGKKINKRAVE